jgi:hypothetical protein
LISLAVDQNTEVVFASILTCPGRKNPLPDFND